MKKNLILIILINILLVVLLFSGCNGLIVRVPDEIETRQFDFSNFTAVDIGDAFSYEIVRADTYAISIKAGKNLIEHIQVVVKDHTLKIDVRPFFTFDHRGPLEAVITMPYLTGLDSAGASDGIVSGFDSTENLSVDLSGASDLVLKNVSAGDLNCTVSGAGTLNLIDLKTNDADFTLSGASDMRGNLIAANTEFILSGASTVQLEGTADDIMIDASGASDIMLSDFTVRNADVTLSGGSECRISPEETLAIDASGASELIYYGDPSIIDINIEGGSEVTKSTG